MEPVRSDVRRRNPKEAGPEDARFTAKLTGIIDITAYNDGVTIQKTQGKPITFVISEPDEDFALVLWRAWQAARGQNE